MIAVWQPTAPQVEFMKTLVKERVPANMVETFWTYNVKTIRSRQQFSDTIDMLKTRPKVNIPAPAVVTPAPVQDLPELANAEGLYRNPVDGALYRLKAGEYGQFIVSVYSKKSQIRRLTTEGNVEKGKWKRLPAHTSRQLTHYSRWDDKGDQKILASWFMSDEDKVEYVYGICLFCYRGLEDARSVVKNYGPVCAKAMGLPWGDEG